ncbi:hypothetical protein VSH64_16530 [Amycolatopsis rhabdoformis]|uniref:Uncharacterized protein n=1 Tax=Amycolatopsis rhabdoformis TaxID=1448059 RepID=A0ABZ1IJ10_9PSEU|nr:hypothetical protein [Amycolatopsis rhabdoformis]WSE33693.1 hypothetical protein VSH64_16530 [Amycolatopsis rhabdoformis]
MRISAARRASVAGALHGERGHGSIADLRDRVGLTADGIAGRITKWAWEKIPAALVAAEPPPRSAAE